MVLDPCNGIPSANEKEWPIDTCNIVNERSQNYMVWLHGYKTLENRDKCIGTRSRSMVAEGDGENQKGRVTMEPEKTGECDCVG